MDDINTALKRRMLLAAGAFSILSVTVPDTTWAVPVDCPLIQDVEICTVTDGNSSFTVDADDLIVLDWSVGGVRQLSPESFFLFDRVSGEAPDADLVSATFDTETKQIVTEFDNPGVLNAKLTFTLQESGGVSQVDESIALSFGEGGQGRVFSFTNFNLNGDNQDDQAVFNGSDAITQTDGTTTGTVEVISGPNPDAFQIDFFPSVLEPLGNDQFVDLTNETNGLGPGDLSSAFSWDFEVADGGSFELTLSKTIENPVFIPVVGTDPDPDDGIGAPFEFDLDVIPGVQYFIDPEVAIGYIYEIGDGNPNFTSVVLPEVGDNAFIIEFLDGATLVQENVLANALFLFPTGGVSQFTVRDIETGAMLDPTDPNAFITGLEFASAGEFTGTMSPIIGMTDDPEPTPDPTPDPDPMPEPGTIMLLGAGLAGLFLNRRRRRRSL